MIIRAMIFYKELLVYSLLLNTLVSTRIRLEFRYDSYFNLSIILFAFQIPFQISKRFLKIYKHFQCYKAQNYKKKSIFSKYPI